MVCLHYITNRKIFNLCSLLDGQDAQNDGFPAYQCIGHLSALHITNITVKMLVRYKYRYNDTHYKLQQ